ncbi:MAG: hypothetical protein K2P27_11330, partial [Lachnospiraceae bacterium]|nr:hypothetical protein [Lachnospiraceae bacterium]
MFQKVTRLTLWADIFIFQLQFAETQVLVTFPDPDRTVKKNRRFLKIKWKTTVFSSIINLSFSNSGGPL